LHDNLKIRDVIKKIGNANYRTFSRAFQKLLNINPSDYIYGNSTELEKIQQEEFCLKMLWNIENPYKMSAHFVY
jgi:hypothetical protein